MGKLLCIIFFLYSISANGQICKVTPEINQYLNYLNLYAASSYAWPGYSLKENIHLIVDLKLNNHCAFVVEKGMINKIILTKDPIAQSNISDSDIEKMIPSSLNQDQHDKIKKRIVDSILVSDWNEISASPFALTKWAPELLDLLKTQSLESLYIVGIHDFSSRLENIVGLAHHEGFHILYQHQIEKRPNWDLQPDRSSMGDLCYKKNLDIKNLYLAEKQAIINAVEAQFREDDIHRADQIQVFKKTRIQRYQKLDELNVFIKGARNKEISCAEAESIMEIEEGIALYVGKFQDCCRMDLAGMLKFASCI